MEDDDYQTFVLSDELDGPDGSYQYRVVNKLQLRYSLANGNEPDTLLVMQPVLSGFQLADPDAPKPFAVLEDEFDDIFEVAQS